MNKILKVYAVADDFVKGAGSRKIPSFAAAGSYYIFMSLVPIVMLLCAVLQYTPLTQEIVMTTLDDYIPPSLYGLVSQIIATVYGGGSIAITISILLTVWSASRSMKALMRGMDSVYDVRRRESGIVFSLRACLYMVVFLLVIVMTLVLLVYGGRILDLLSSYLPSTEPIEALLNLLHYLRFVVSLAVMTVVFMVLYRWMPATTMRYRHQWAGALFTSASWFLFSYIFSLYLSISDRFGAYGMIGTIMVAMMWMYYCLFFLLIGGYINCRLDVRRAVISHETDHPDYDPDGPRRVRN